MVYAAIQPNGERLLFEEWAVRAWQSRTLNDPELTRPLNSAILIREAHWPLTDNEKRILRQHGI